MPNSPRAESHRQSHALCFTHSLFTLFAKGHSTLHFLSFVAALVREMRQKIAPTI
jgi:hypothetical protein